MFILKGALYLNCAAVGAFFRPMKKAKKRLQKLDVNTKEVEEHLKTELLKIPSPALTNEVDGNSQIESVDEELKATHIKVDHVKQVCK